MDLIGFMYQWYNVVLILACINATMSVTWAFESLVLNDPKHAVRSFAYDMQNVCGNGNAQQKYFLQSALMDMLIVVAVLWFKVEFLFIAVALAARTVMLAYRHVAPGYKRSVDLWIKDGVILASSAALLLYLITWTTCGFML